MDLPTFRTLHPEFVNVPDVSITGMLAEAALEVNAQVWGVHADAGIHYLAAHKLALSPYGTGTRLRAADGSTTYWTHYEKLRRQVASGYRVI